MNWNLLTRRDFVRLATTAAALPAAAGAALEKTLAPGAAADLKGEGAGKTTVPDPREMQSADDWLHAFTAPTAGWKKQSDSALLPEVIKPSFSFRYDSRPSSELLASWKLASSTPRLTEAGRSFEVTYTDPQTGLVIRVVALQYQHFPAVEWVVYLKNSGSADTPILEDIQALDSTLVSPQQEDLAIHYARGATCSMNDFMPMLRKLNIGGVLHVEPGGGRSSSDFLPFFNLETKGEGVVVALGWTGEWAMNFSRHDGASVQVRSGMACTHLKLHPGEEIRTPRVLTLFWRGDPVRGNNLLRRLILSYHRPSAGNRLVTMPMCNANWGATSAAVHLDNIRQIERHKLTMDYYWIDAGWFGNGPWWTNAGDWRVNQTLYPQGFKPISNLLHQSGYKFLLWFEPERVCEGTPWYTEHAKWLLEVPKDKRVYNWGNSQEDPNWVRNESLRNQIKENDRLFDLGIPAAREFLTDFISNKIDEFGIDCYRHDANIAPLQFWRAADAPDRQGITEIRWVEGLYAFWDGLKERHPNLVIDVCASGGRRIDLETMSRCVPLTRTDFPNSATGNQCHTYGLLYWAPLNSTLAGNLGDNTDYHLRSSMCTGVAFGLFGHDDHAQTKQDYDSFPFERVRQELERQRQIEKYYYGDYYPLTQYSQAEDAWEAYQLHLADTQEGLIVVLKRPLSHFITAVFPLKALHADRSYEFLNIDTGERSVLSGKDILQRGLRFRLPRKPDSALIRYRLT